MLSLYRMNKEQMLKFVKLYKKHECLWNTDSILYRNRAVRLNALQKISDEMQIKDFGPKEVARKIKNLRSTYNQELKKIVSSEKPGVSADSVYKPKLLWFDLAREIFTKYNHIDSTSTNHNLENETDMINEQNFEEDGRIYQLQLDFVKEEAFEGFQPQIEEEINVFADTQSKDEVESVNRISDVVVKLEDVVKSVQTLKGDFNEYDAFGQYVSSALKSLPAESAINVQTEVMRIIALEKKKYLISPN